MILGTAGHIDHGKTALVRALTGVDTDRLPEEKRRGITIELGFAPLAIEGFGTIGIVDVPGHEAFVRTMLAGATGIDLAMLVVAADEGVMPQTREHLEILKLLGIRGGLVALTKRDLVDEEWLELVREDVRALVTTSGLAGGPIIPTSTVTGEGIAQLKSALSDLVRDLPARERNDVFRMPVDRAFSAKGTGTVVTGTIWSGSLKSDAVLTLFPGGRLVRVRGIQSHGRDVAESGPGTRTAIALAGIDVTDVSRGGILVDHSGWRESSLIRAQVALLESSSRPLRPREWVRLHLGTSEVGARVVASGGAIGVGEMRAARVLLDEPLATRAGDRFVLRRGSPPETIGGGRVLDPSPTHRRARPWLGIEIGDHGHLEALLRDADQWGVALDQLPIRLGIAPADVTSLVKSFPEAVWIGGRVFHAPVIESVRRQLLTAVQEFHASNPLAFGMPTAEWRARVHADAELVTTVERTLATENRVRQLRGLVQAFGWRPALSHKQEQLRERILGQMRVAGIEAPSVAELEKEFGNETVPLLRILADEGVVVQLDAERYLTKAALDESRHRLRRGMQEVEGPHVKKAAESAGGGRREFTASELREILGVSRKFLIPLLEHFDREGVTERRNTGRVLHDG